MAALLRAGRLLLGAGGAARRAGGAAAGRAGRRFAGSSGAPASSSGGGGGGGGEEGAAPAYADYPGLHRVPFTEELRASEPATQGAVPCFRVLDGMGNVIPGSEEFEIAEEQAVAMYRTMVKLQVMDTHFYEAQRMGRFSFYMTSFGEEAAVVASAAALDGIDQVFAQYREQGALLWRGFTFQEAAAQCFGAGLDACKGRQMPVHYGSRKLNYHTISSPLGTQLPHAVGAGYSMKLQGDPGIAVAYFGEGAASEGDFHAALNFAATLKVPVLFVCRNNGWAISTPSSEQYRGDGIAGRGEAYGVRAIRVDGGDALAVHGAARVARELAAQGEPVLLEAMTYRVGHHSTSDDSSRYRAADEMRSWEARDPVKRFQMYLEGKGWWCKDQEASLRRTAREEVITSLDEAEELPKPDLSELFEDVYDELPSHLAAQKSETLDFARRNPELVPPGVPVAP